MKVRNLETGEIETLRHGPATEAVTAGTHEFVNLGEDDGEPITASPTSEANKPNLDRLTKGDLVALAKDRGVPHDEGATKAQIVEALRAAEAG